MTISWTLTAGDLVSDAAQRILLLGSEQNLSAYQWARGKAHLNAMMKLLQTQGENQWRRANQTVDLIEGQAGYELSPRPDKVREVFHVDASGRELIMGRWSYDDYDTLPTKTQKGRPTVYTIDRQRTATNLVVWPTPDAANAALTLRVSYDRVMEDVNLATDPVDVPQEWLDCVTDSVAARLATDFRIENPSAMEVKQRAAASLEALLGHDAEPSIYFSVGE